MADLTTICKIKRFSEKNVQVTLLSGSCCKADQVYHLLDVGGVYCCQPDRIERFDIFGFKISESCHYDIRFDFSSKERPNEPFIMECVNGYNQGGPVRDYIIRCSSEEERQEVLEILRPFCVPGTTIGDWKGNVEYI